MADGSRGDFSFLNNRRTVANVFRLPSFELRMPMLVLALTSDGTTRASDQSSADQSS